MKLLYRCAATVVIESSHGGGISLCLYIKCMYYLYYNIIVEDFYFYLKKQYLIPSSAIKRVCNLQFYQPAGGNDFCRRSATNMYDFYVFGGYFFSFLYTCSRWGWRRISIFYIRCGEPGETLIFVRDRNRSGCRVCARKYVFSITSPLLYASSSYTL